MKPSDILYIIPTRGRPDSMVEVAKAWEQTKAYCKVMFAVDDDDETLPAYKAHAERLGLNLQIRERLRLAGTLNLHALEQASNFKAIGFQGDDHRPRTVGWDVRFAECLSGGAGVVYGDDLLVHDGFPTAVCMTSDIISTLGYMCPPGFTHLCLDLVWKDWGVGMGRITYLGDVVIEHLHPANQKAAWDARYEEVNSHEMVDADTKAYFAYREGPAFERDMKKLRRLL